MTADRGARGRLDDDQLRWLLQPLQPYRVATKEGHSHLQAWDVRRHLLRVFGWGGWDEETVAVTLQHAEAEERPRRNPKPNQPPTYKAWTVVYTAVVRLTVRNRAGEVVAVFEEGAAGDATSQPSVGDAHDLAIKSALSQALKRCAANLGDGFGLGLYNGGRLDGVVGRSLGHPEPEQETAAPDLGAGDQQVEEEAHDRAQRAQDEREQERAGEPPWVAQDAPSTHEEARLQAAQRIAHQVAEARTLDDLRGPWRATTEGDLRDVEVLVPAADGGPDRLLPLVKVFSQRRAVIEAAS